MVIALLTDFGTRDYFVAAMKGVILSINPNVSIVDITHEIEPQNIKSAAFTLAACYRNFPAKTIFVAIVDPGVGSDRKAILVETEKYYFIAPDNGLLSFVFDTGGSPRVSKGADLSLENAPLLTRGLLPSDFRVFELSNEKYFADKVSRTFHGRDVFAPVAAHLSNGVEPNEFGREINDFTRFDISQPKQTAVGKVEGEIIHIDRFGNLVTNLKPEDLPEAFSIEIGGEIIDRIKNFYAEAERDEIFMIWGSAGYLEITAWENSASELLKAVSGAKLRVIVKKPKKSD